MRSRDTDVGAGAMRELTEPSRFAMATAISLRDGFDGPALRRLAQGSKDGPQAGDHALLNLGHTFGHALEAATGYSSRLLHGEGVAIGMVLAFQLSAKLGLAPAAMASASPAICATAVCPQRSPTFPAHPRCRHPPCPHDARQESEERQNRFRAGPRPRARFHDKRSAARRGARGVGGIGWSARPHFALSRTTL